MTGLFLCGGRVSPCTRGFTVGLWRKSAWERSRASRLRGAPRGGNGSFPPNLGVAESAGAKTGGIHRVGTPHDPAAAAQPQPAPNLPIGGTPNRTTNSWGPHERRSCAPDP
ncbi:hypothetical protein GCM10010345_26870 [Streptomyces canarius]|uniref:Uncharacterized protein n=1 Tax=Streptomyces canarius TaxID=285453 RepID=A0ABQ3CJA4_9ACTN|nr:hypothetical protein GCM10010345_26870 [Streptomyces canarius]